MLAVSDLVAKAVGFTLVALRAIAFDLCAHQSNTPLVPCCRSTLLHIFLYISWAFVSPFFRSRCIVSLDYIFVRCLPLSFLAVSIWFECV